MGGEIRAAVAKTGKWAVSESGDTVEMVERPRGGLSAIIADGQGSGRAAKRISNQVVNKAAALIGDGARDGAVARAVGDYLYALRDGKVLATLTILSADLHTGTFVVSRNAPTPVLVRTPTEILRADEAVDPIGARTAARPAIREWPLEAETVVLTFTDGILHAGGFGQDAKALARVVEQLAGASALAPEVLVDQILAQAVAADSGRPADDMAVVALTAVAPQGSRETGPSKVRRLKLQFPY